MRAKEAYRLIVRRSGIMPAFLAHHDRIDHIELVSIESGEVVLYWDCPAHRAKQLSGQMREEMAVADAEDFIARWSAVAG